MIHYTHSCAWTHLHTHTQDTRTHAHTWLSHVPRTNTSRDTWMGHVAHMIQSYHTNKWVKSHTWIIWTPQYVMSHTRIRHVTRMNGSCRTYESVITQTNESTHTYETYEHLNKSCHTHEYATWHMEKGGITHMYVIRDTCVWITPHTWMSHVPRKVSSFKCVTWLIRACECVCVSMIYSCVSNDSHMDALSIWISVTHMSESRDTYETYEYLIQMCDATHSCVWVCMYVDDSLICVTHMCAIILIRITHSYGYLIQMGGVTWIASYVWRVTHTTESHHTYASYEYLIQMCNVTHSCAWMCVCVDDLFICVNKSSTHTHIHPCKWITLHIWKIWIPHSNMYATALIWIPHPYEWDSHIWMSVTHTNESRHIYE